MSRKDSEKNSVGSKIKSAREEASLTQEELAETIDITRQQLAKYEKNKVSPTVDTLLKIASACSTKPEKLLPKENLVPAHK